MNITETANTLSGTPPSTVTINANQTTATLTAATDDDDIDEDASVITAALQAGIFYVVGTPSSARVLVLNNDLPPSMDATLSSLTINPGQLNPAFDPETLSYTALLPNAVSTITVTAAANNAGATVSINGQNTTTLDVPFTEDTMVITVTVTAEDNITQLNYTITVTHAPAGIPQLTITADDASVTEGEAATFTITAYPPSVTALTVNVNITETANTLSGTPPATVTISAGHTTATLTVATDDDDVDEHASIITALLQARTGYTVSIPSLARVFVLDNDVTLSTDATLSSLTINPGQLNPAFDPETLSYTALLPNAVSTITVTAAANNAGATVSINGQNTTTLDVPFTEDTMVITVTVTAEDNITQLNYTITVTRAPAGGPQLTITADDANVTEGEAATFTIIATPAPTTTITVNVNITETGNVFSGTPDSTITISANQTTLTVATDDDNADEDASVVTAALQARTGYTLGTPSSASVTVDDNDVPNRPATGTPTIIGTPEVGETLTADVSNIQDADGLENVTYTYQWFRVTGNLHIKISNATDAMYEVVTADIGHQLKVRVNFSDDLGNAEELESALTAIVVAPVVTPVLTISTNAPSLTEGEAATFTITATPTPTTAITVNVNVTETANTFSGTPDSTITISAGQTTATLTVATDDDDVDEDDSVVTAQVQPGTGYTVGTPSSARVLVLDDELPPSMDATLSSLTISPGALNPTFGPETLSYTTSVANAVSTITVTATANNAGATVSINGQNTTTLDVPFTEDKTLITVTVTAEDNSTQLNYTITITRAAPGVPQLTIAANPTSVTEGEAATFTITATPAPTTAITVNVNVTETANTLSGTPPATVTISANQTILTVATDDDDVEEDASVITARLQAGTDYTVGIPSSASITVNDNDAPNSPATGVPTIIGTPEVGETLTADVSNIQDANGLENVTYTYQWFRVTGNVQIKISNATDATYEVVTADSGYQLKVRVNFTDDLGYTEELESALTSTVVAPVVTPVLTISANAPSVTEGTAATFTITATPAPTTALTLNVNITETGNVFSGTPDSTITISANQTTATLTVATDDDNIDEDASVITALLQAGTGYTVGTPSSATVTVNDNDIPTPVVSQVTISANAPSVTEGTAATFTITATPAPTTALTLNVNITETGNVFSGTPDSTITISANQTTATLTVATDDDNIDEDASVITAQLQAGTGYTVGTPSSATVTVNDNDIPTPVVSQVTISANAPSVTEGTAATFTITATPAPTTALTLNVNITETGNVFSGTPDSNHHHQRQPDHRHTNSRNRRRQCR